MHKLNTENPLEKLSFFSKKDNSLEFDDHSMGLTSRIFRMYKSSDVKKQNKGVLLEGMRHYPPAKPNNIIRVFKKQFDDFLSAFSEAKKQNILIKYLGDHVVKSQEFIVEGNKDDLEFLEIQHKTERAVILLCGFQDYIEGIDFDLSLFVFNIDELKSYQEKGNPIQDGSVVFNKVMLVNFEKQLFSLIKKIEKIITEEKMIPDLGGPGNIKITKEGKILLVDINNIHTLAEDLTEIPLIRDVPMVHSSLCFFYDLHKIAGIDPDSKPYFEQYFNESIRKEFLEIINADMESDTTGRC